MQDGQTVREFGELESVAEDLGDKDGALYAYVAASGTVYLASPNSKLRKRLRRRIGS
jgi:rRNA-processing protein FCF1